MVLPFSEWGPMDRTVLRCFRVAESPVPGFLNAQDTALDKADLLKSGPLCRHRKDPRPYRSLERILCKWKKPWVLLAWA